MLLVLDCSSGDTSTTSSTSALHSSAISASSSLQQQQLESDDARHQHQNAADFGMENFLTKKKTNNLVGILLVLE